MDVIIIAMRASVKLVAILFALWRASSACNGATVQQSDHWAWARSVTSVIGYDSNLALRLDGTGAGFLILEPSLKLKRIASATQLEFEGKLASTFFFDRGHDRQLDPSIAVTYSYPEDERVLRLTGGATLSRNTLGNESVGERISVDAARVNFGGRWLWSGKIGVAARASYDATAYEEQRLVDHELASVAVGMVYQPDPRIEYSLNLISAHGATDPGPRGTAGVKSWEEGLTLRAKGKLSPKLNGSIYAGAEVVEYRGAFRRRQGLPVGGGELGWQLGPRGWIYGGLQFSADFSPEGQALEIQRCSIRCEQTIYKAWRSETFLSAGRTFYYRETRQRVDRISAAGVAVIYAPSTRLVVRAEYGCTTQESDVRFANFDRHVSTTRLTYRF